MTRPVALVTGGCRRLGAHIAARLATAGYRLALHAGHDASPEDWLAERLADVEHDVFVADLDDGAAVDALPGRVVARFGAPVTLLVNNASRFDAMGQAAGITDLAAHFATNASAPVALALAVAAEGAAAVINILDQRIAHPPRDQLAYTLSKQALAEATRTLARALAPGCRVNGVAPGLTLPTPDYAEGQVERIARLMPLSRLPDPSEVADAVAWLAAARSVTGQVLFVDGGAHLKSFERDFVNLAR